MRLVSRCVWTMLTIKSLAFCRATSNSNPQIHWGFELEVARQNANDLIVNIVQTHRLTNRIVCAAELSLPQPVGNQGDVFASPARFFGHEIAALHRLHTERWQERRQHPPHC